MAASSPMNATYLSIDGQEESITGIDPAQAPQLLSLTMQSGSMAALTQGQLLVDANMARSRQLAVGSTLPTAFPDGTTGTLRVGGIYAVTPLVNSMTMINNAVLTGHGVKPSYDQVLVKERTARTARWSRRW